MIAVLVARAIRHMRSAVLFVMLSFLVTQGPLGVTGAVTPEVWASYHGPSSFIVPSHESYVIDLKNYFWDAWNFSVAPSQEIIVVQDGSRLIVYADGFVGESNITIAIRTPQGLMKQSIPVLAYPDVSSAVIHDHNAPSWMRSLG